MTDAWKEAVGEKPNRVTILERVDKGLAVYLRWYIAGRPRYQACDTKSVRDSRGRLKKRLQDKARAEAFAKIEELEGTRKPKRGKGPMTLRDGVRLAFTDRGCYPLDPDADQWTKDARNYIEQVLPLLGGPDVPWEKITPGQIRAVWRQVEKEGGSADKAKKMLTVFFRIARWLEGEFQEMRFPRSPQGWRTELEDHWRKKGHDLTPFQPRHSVKEIALLLRHRDKADPRMAMLLVLGPQLRGGQIIRAMRSHLTIEGDLWRLVIPYVSRRKRIPPLTLNHLERASLKLAMTEGYLSLAEEAFQAKRIKDYALFPGGKLREGKARADRCQHPVSNTTIPGWFHAYEEAAGVTPVSGRAWHGMRRGFSDYYATLYKEGKIKDPRLLDLLQGWIPGSDMRTRTYNEQESDELQQDAADIRMIRPDLDPNNDD